MKTKQILLKSFSFFVILGLLFADISVASAKKKKKKGKKNSKVGKKSSSAGVSQPSIPVQTPDSRAGYSNNMAGYSRGRGGQQQQQMTPEQEEASLTDKLMACLNPVCDGSVAYEKCFKTSGIDVHFVSVPDCVAYLNAASSEDIKIRAKNNVKEKIKKYFKDACTEAGGTTKGERCKFDIYYYAKSPDGKHKKKEGPTTHNVGQMLTCSYSNFGLSESSLQYELEMDAATKGALINSGIQMGMGVLQGGMKIFQANKTKKELEKTTEPAGLYKFNGSTLKKDDNCDISRMCSAEGFTEFCCHKFEKDFTQIEKQEKLAELIRSKKDLSGLKQKAERQETINMWAQHFSQQSLSEDLKKEKDAKKKADLIGNALYGSNMENTAQTEYSKALSAYNTNQGTLNQNREKLENAGKDLQDGIADISKGVLGGGTQMVTSLMTAKENKGTMTGACYLGDPENGGTLFASEGETKKISWR